MTLAEIITLIRKEGSIKMKTKDQALIIQEAAKGQGYIFEIKKEGWNWLVIDLGGHRK